MNKKITILFFVCIMFTNFQLQPCKDQLRTMLHRLKNQNAIEKPSLKDNFIQACPEYGATASTCFKIACCSWREDEVKCINCSTRENTLQSVANVTCFIPRCIEVITCSPCLCYAYHTMKAIQKEESMSDTEMPSVCIIKTSIEK